MKVYAHFFRIVMTRASLFIGRFQPFHLGHLFVLKNCTTDTIYIGIGSSQYHHTIDNPFTYEERKTMIRLTLEEDFDIKYGIYPVDDIHDPPRWVDHVKTCLPPFTTVLTNNHITASLFKEKGFTVIYPGLRKRDLYKGEIIRDRMRTDQSWEHLVPSSVAKFLHTIDAVKRLKTFSKKNKK